MILGSCPAAASALPGLVVSAGDTVHRAPGRPVRHPGWRCVSGRWPSPSTVPWAAAPCTQHPALAPGSPARPPATPAPAFCPLSSGPGQPPPPSSVPSAPCPGFAIHMLESCPAHWGAQPSQRVRLLAPGTVWSSLVASWRDAAQQVGQARSGMEGSAARAACCQQACSWRCWPQVIDVQAGLLQNVITFPPEGAFIVDSDISLAGPQRVQF
ncbi:cytochrome P450, partial [Haematococcus lacustris]